MKSYREWKNETVINELGEVDTDPGMNRSDIARSTGQGMNALKQMNPGMMAFASNLTRTLSEIETAVPGFTKKFINKMIMTLNTATDLQPGVANVLKAKLMQALAKLPQTPAPLPTQPQMQAQPQ